MEYSEEKAVEIISTFQLDKKIRDLWKHRGTIPDHYNNEFFEPYHLDRTPVEQYHLEQVLDILHNKKLHHKNISEHIGLKGYYRLRDAVRGKARLSTKEVEKLRVFFKQQRIEIAKTLSQIDERKIMEDKPGLLLCELYQNPFFHSGLVIKETGVSSSDAAGLVKRLVKKISNGGTPLDQDRRTRMKNAYEVLMLEITLK